MRRLFQSSVLTPVAAVLAAQLFWVPPGPAQAGPPDLFAPAAPGARKAPKRQLGPAILRSRRVSVNLALLTRAAPQQQMTLNFMGEKAYTAVVEEVAARSPRRATMRGRLAGIEGSSFLIVRCEDAVAGVFRFAGSPRLYQLRPGGDGAHLVSEVDTSRYPPEACFASLPVGGPAAGPLPGGAIQGAAPVADAPGGGEASAPACGPLPTVLDVMLVYTPAARQAMGGTHEAAIAQCQLAIAVANEAYTDSLINPRLRLVHCTEVAYTESNDMGTDLDWLTSPATAPQVHADRDTYRADFVSMIISYGSGLGWCGGGETKAFCVVKWDRAVNTWSLAHEIGHNQGCNHNREDAGGGCGADSYSYGYHFLGDSGIRWGTIMSYQGTRISHFSNPNVLYDGQPTGVPIGEADEAYNVKTINTYAWLHEGYRLTRYDIWVDFNRVCSLLSPCDGTFDYPYDTLADAIAEVPVGENPSEPPNLWIKSSTSGETLTIDKPMTLRACDGAVTIGATP